MTHLQTATRLIARADWLIGPTVPTPRDPADVPGTRAALAAAIAELTIARSETLSCTARARIDDAIRELREGMRHLDTTTARLPVSDIIGHIWAGAEALTRAAA